MLAALMNSFTFFKEDFTLKPEKDCYLSSAEVGIFKVVDEKCLIFNDTVSLENMKL